MKLFAKKSEALEALKKTLSKENDIFKKIVIEANHKNKWFAIPFIWQQIDAINEMFLNEEYLIKWLEKYSYKKPAKTLGLILAGNIPLVGFHDILVAFVSDIPTKIKLSNKDRVLVSFVLEQLSLVDSNWKFEIVDKLTYFDSVIATGSNNTNRYFSYYFGKVPNILRKNRNSIAVLDGNESKKDLEKLGADIFSYFGLGCRNVSKIWVPQNYPVEQLFDSFSSFSFVKEHHLYKDNYDYNRTLLLMNKTPHLANDFLILKEDDSLHSRLATVHYSFYKNKETIQNEIIYSHSDIQCIVSAKNKLWNATPFGTSQYPKVNEYADNKDTLHFILSL